jgi:hypothetical protein
MQYNLKVAKALKEISNCQKFLEAKTGFKKYAEQYSERVSYALFHLQEARKSLSESNTAFFGGKAVIEVR